MKTVYDFIISQCVKEIIRTWIERQIYLMNPEIRLATQDDFGAVGKIFAEENQFHADLVPEIIQVTDPIMTHEWFYEILSNPNKRLFVAVIGSELVGVVLVEIRTNIDDPIFTPRKYVFVDELAVAESHRSRGIGRLLMERVRRLAKSQNINAIELQVWERNIPAMGFYKNIGYKTWRRAMRLNLNEQLVEA
jgi:ribosomal protein S18 acetylase RimI-like enzyme